MWEDEIPDTNDDLRQGDLVADFHFPVLKLPFQIAHSPGQAIHFEDRMVLKQKPGYALVVTQCCSVAQNDFVALALVHPVPINNSTFRDALCADEPPEEDSGGGYLMDLFRLTPCGAHLTSVSPTSEQCADLGKIFTVNGDQSILRDARVGRMRTHERRLLRIKLSLFFGRAEEDDIARLHELGLPPGMTRSG
jgi:hypothetical protein